MEFWRAACNYDFCPRFLHHGGMPNDRKEIEHEESVEEWRQMDRKLSFRKKRREEEEETRQTCMIRKGEIDANHPAP